MCSFFTASFEGVMFETPEHLEKDPLCEVMWNILVSVLVLHAVLIKKK